MNARTYKARIDRAMDRATEDDILEGKVWYANAQALAVELAAASDLDVLQAACVIAHLSPKVTWALNKRAAQDLVLRGVRTPGIMNGPFDRALKASQSADPISTFGKAAKKTRSFALNIAGFDQEVTVDIWIARAMGVTEAQLKHVGVYEGIAHQFRLASKRYGMAPMQVQAIVWIVTRGKAN